MDAKINNSTFIRNTTLYLQKCELQNKICNVLLFVYRIFYHIYLHNSIFPLKSRKKLFSFDWTKSFKGCNLGFLKKIDSFQWCKSISGHFVSDVFLIQLSNANSHSFFCWYSSSPSVFACCTAKSKCSTKISKKNQLPLFFFCQSNFLSIPLPTVF